jgi:hypothetical protein
LSALSSSFNIYYVFNNKRFSYRPFFSFTQSQIKSAGSFIIGTYLSDFSFTADSFVVDDHIQYLFSSFPLLLSGNSFSTGLSFLFQEQTAPLLNSNTHLVWDIHPANGFMGVCSQPIAIMHSATSVPIK